MQDYIEERVLETAQYIIDKGATVREAAKVFKISKSTVHKDMSDRLPRMNSSLYRQVHQVLEHNKAERHIRGGMATYRKYKGAIT
ncbi:Stage III sporulation protein D [bioreactor metagenome]|uniref:Stage III sporulation protein D n=1 Tax=bioreactor metagenome TaxID=1076179 RepID=A0A645JM41_9ZZZZ